jgi:DNA-binding protein YbaB
MDSMKKAQEIAKQAEAMNRELAQMAVVGSDPS